MNYLIQLKGNSINKKRDTRYPFWRRSNEFYDAFDIDTLFYAATQVNNKIILDGPPLRNFKKELNKCEIFIDDKKIEKRSIVLRDKKMSQNSLIILNDCKKRNEIRIKGNEIDLSIEINQQFNEALKGKKIISTFNKNNDISWIIDWINFYKNEHDILHLWFLIIVLLNILRKNCVIILKSKALTSL